VCGCSRDEAGSLRAGSIATTQATDSQRSAVSLRVVEVDRYQRTVAEVYVGSTAINLQMVREGQAVVYQQYLSGCPGLRNQLLQAEQQAKRQRLQFWSQARPVMPWEYRQRQRG
jgi:micrococcal nuclease